MKKIAIIVGIIILAIVSLILIKDILIKRELSKVAETQVLDSKKSEPILAQADSIITLQKYEDTWTIDSTGEYVVDPESLSVEFVGYKPGGEHTGTFKTINGEISLDAEGNPVQARVVLDVSSVKTDAEALDTHLQTAEFFDVATYPVIDAVVKTIKIKGTVKEAVVDLTMKGVTKTLIVPVTVTSEEGSTMFKIDTRVKISDYNIAYGPVLDEVRIMLEATIIKK